MIDQIFRRFFNREDIMSYLIVGLGNIGAEYNDTRHNIGFNILDQYAKENELKFSVAKLGSVAEHRYAGKRIVLLKPSTYMNLSGKALNYWMQKEKIPLDRVLVLVDDVALPFGALRLRGKGSDAGHNGLKDIAATINTTGYARLKFGIGDNYRQGGQIDYVLGKWGRDELLDLPERLDRCSEIINSFVKIGLPRTMNEFNNK